MKNSVGNIFFIILILFILVFIAFQSQSVFGGDGGDLVTTAVVRGVAHPPGYPLYTFLGFLLTKLTVFTPAWRVGLLSSIPASLTLGLLFLIINKLIKNTLISFLSVLVLGFSYLYWLYAEVPEVFSLHLLFSAGIFYLLLQFNQTKNFKYLYISSFLFGLSLTHHHTIVLLIPAFLSLIIHNRSDLQKISSGMTFKLVILFFSGLIPYIYVYFAALGKPFINWENPVTITGFVRLITRAIYGTFRSNPQFGIEFSDRINLLKVYFETLQIDFTNLGVGLIIIGFLMHFKQKKFFWPVFLAFLFSGPLFLFYAAFPSNFNFYLGTSERFFLLSYLFLTIWLACGINFSVNFVDHLISKIIRKKNIISSLIIFSLYPLLILQTSFPKISSLKNDFTAEKLGKDILKSVPDNSFIFLTDDTAVFPTQYVYVLNLKKYKEQNIKIIQTGLLGTPFYPKVLNYIYPDLKISQSNPENYLYENLIEENFEKYQIYSTSKLLLSEKYTFLPYGLLWKIYKKQDLEKVAVNFYKEQNEKLFASYHDPLAGFLDKYLHVLPADILRLYANSRREVGSIFLKMQEYGLAESYFQEAVRLQPEMIINKINLGTSFIFNRKCTEAEKLLTETKNLFPDNPATYYALSLLYLNCYEDREKSENYQKIYEEKVRQSETLLKNF